MHNPFTAVVFDFDGTLADGYLAITQSANFVRTEYGLPPLTAADVRPLVGRGLESLLRDLVPVGDPIRDIAAFRAHYAETMVEGTQLYPPARRLLPGLQNSGRKLAVCSNKPSRFTKPLLAQLGIASFFSEVLGPEDVSRPKPAPDMIVEAIRRLDSRPDQTLYVGDMRVDIEAGRAAGVTVWIVATGSEDRTSPNFAEAHRVFDDLAGVADQLLGPAA